MAFTAYLIKQRDGRVVIPDGIQYMQTATGWGLMTEPMQAAKILTVPATGKITLPVLSAIDLSGAVGTLVYVGMGSTWEDVRSLNMAGHYYSSREPNAT